MIRWVIPGNQSLLVKRLSSQKKAADLQAEVSGFNVFEDALGRFFEFHFFDHGIHNVIQRNRANLLAIRTNNFGFGGT